MVQIVNKSRLHLLPAKAAPVMVILQRKRAKLLHVIKLNTRTHQIEHGSWFRGKLYKHRCDVSFDGKFMVYLAMGDYGDTWNGICQPPWLKTRFDAKNLGSWNGGGYFSGKRVLKTNSWRQPSPASVETNLPFVLEPYLSRYGGEDLGVIYERLERDGFVRVGDNWGTPEERQGARKYTVDCHGDDGWRLRYSRRHPALHVHYLGYLEHGYTFAFSLAEYPGLIDDAAWAAWDANGSLWVARNGQVEKFDSHDFKQGKPSFVLDVEPFEPPPRTKMPTGQVPPASAGQ
jgi:hypothetical protein